MAFSRRVRSKGAFETYQWYERYTSSTPIPVMPDTWTNSQWSKNTEEFAVCPLGTDIRTPATTFRRLPPARSMRRFNDGDIPYTNQRFWIRNVRASYQDAVCRQTAYFWRLNQMPTPSWFEVFIITGPLRPAAALVQSFGDSVLLLLVSRHLTVVEICPISINRKRYNKSQSHVGVKTAWGTCRRFR